MSTAILYQNGSKTVTLLDLPASIEDAQHSPYKLRSSPAPQQPYPSTEPKGARWDAIVASLPVDEREYHRDLQNQILDTLEEIKLYFVQQPGTPWCCERCPLLPVARPTALETVERHSTFDSTSTRNNESPLACSVPLILSSTDSLSVFPTLGHLHNVVVSNPGDRTSTAITSDGNEFLIPPRSTFLCSTLQQGLSCFTSAVRTLPAACGRHTWPDRFDLILMDPPWANRSARHAKSYSTSENQRGDPFQQALKIVEAHVVPGGLVAVWITNKAAIRGHVVQSFESLGLFLQEEWIWIKTTVHGEPTTPLNGIWRKPYETVLLFRQGPSQRPHRRIIAAVPDVHSRKPSLKRLLEELLPADYAALELFARSLTAGWWSWGDDVLKFQHVSCWHGQQDSSSNGRHISENNPDVMTSLVRELGLSPSLQFHDVYSLTEPSLLEFLPRPALALLLVFPVTETYETFRRSEDASKPEYSGSGPGEEVVWFKQTIRNACGLIGLLHSITNGAARDQIVPGSDLDGLLTQAIPLKPVERADLLYNSQALEAAHASAAAKGDTSAPEADANVELHFVAFVKSQNGDLWELDGRRKGPLKRGRLEPDEDVLSERGQELGVRAFLKREEEAGGGELRFSVIMLGPSLD